MEKSFWEKPIRIIQNNLRAIDAVNLDVEALIREQRDYGTNAIIANAGGLLSWYDSKIAEQPKNAYLEFDYVEAVIREAHKYGIKVLLRMDVSNVYEEEAKLHPERVRRDVNGNPTHDLGMLQSCFNSDKWQTYNFEVLKELLESYDADGIFYNAVHYAFCHCDHCREKYLKDTGRQLPESLHTDTEEGRAYIRYRYNEVTEYFKRVSKFIKDKKPDAILALCNNLASDWPEFNCFSGWDTVPLMGVQDIQANEAVNTVLRRQPKWIYLAGENARMANAMNKRSLVCLHHSGQIGRRAAQAPAQLVYDILQTAAFGGSPAINLIGTFEQDDRKSLPALKSVYNYLKINNDVYDGLINKAKVAVVFSKKSVDFESGRELKATSLSEIISNNYPSRHLQEYRGIYEALVQKHIPFDVLHDGILTSVNLKKYDAILLPSVTCMDEEQIAAVDAYVERGGALVVTGDGAATKDACGRDRGKFGLQCLPFEMISSKSTEEGYLRVEDKRVWKSFAEVDSIGFMGSWMNLIPREDAEVTGKDLYRVPKVKINKPEYAYTTEITKEPGLLAVKYGKGMAAILPWNIGMLFREYGIVENDKLLSDLLDWMGVTRDLHTNAPYTVEVAWGEGRTGEVLHLMNATGLQGKPQIDEIFLHDITVSLRTQALRAGSLTTCSIYETQHDGEYLTIRIPKLGIYEAISIQ